MLFRGVFFFFFPSPVVVTVFMLIVASEFTGHYELYLSVIWDMFHVL